MRAPVPLEPTTLIRTVDPRATPPSKT
jgi:hypothetical protein